MCYGRLPLFIAPKTPTKTFKNSIFPSKLMPQIVPYKQCGIRTPYTDLKPNARGIWICQNCTRKEQKAAQVEKTQPQISTSKPLTKEKEPTGDYRYKCESCNYDVYSSRDLLGKMCPYCGQKGTLKPKKTSSDIIKEVSDWAVQ